MKLDGYRCDECKVESYEKQGDWLQVISTRISHGMVGKRGTHMNEFPQLTSDWSASFATPLHFCSVACMTAWFDPDKPVPEIEVPVARKKR